MLADITAWFLDLVIKIFKTIGNVLMDTAVATLDGILGALTALINAIPAPTFLSGYSLSMLVNGLPDSVMYFASHLRIGEAMAIIGAGFAFRMTRKVLTLFQW